MCWIGQEMIFLGNFFFRRDNGYEEEHCSRWRLRVYHMWGEFFFLHWAVSNGMRLQPFVGKREFLLGYIRRSDIPLGQRFFCLALGKSGI